MIAAGLRQNARAQDRRLARSPSAMRETVTSVPDKDRASLPGWDAAHASAGESALPRRFPGQPGELEGHGIGESPEQVLHAVIGDHSGQLACRVAEIRARSQVSQTKPKRQILGLAIHLDG